MEGDAGSANPLIDGLIELLEKAPATGSLPILFIPIVTFLFIIAGGLLCNREGASATAPDEVVEKKQLTVRKHSFKGGMSWLDTDGNMMTPFKPMSAESRLDQSDMHGFFNLMIVISLLWLASQIVLNLFEVNHPLDDEGKWLLSLFHYGPALIAPVLGLYGLFCLGFVYQLAVVSGSLPGRGPIAILFQVTLETAMVGGAMVYTRSPLAQGWPLSQRAALLMEACVLAMKIHSYLSINRQLADKEANRAVEEAGAELAPARPSPSDTDGATEEAAAVRDAVAQAAARRRRRSGRARSRSPAARRRTQVKDEPQVGRSGSVLSLVASDSGVGSQPEDGWIVPAKPVRYPANVTALNFWEYSWFPTLCYEPSYPRTTHVRPGYLMEKAVLCIGLVAIGVMMMTEYINKPIANIRKENVVLVLSNLVVPCGTLWMIVFFILFECVLNGLAEISRFGDRRFYGPWWNSTSFTEFARMWNQPVHEWLLRHVYLDGQRELALSSNAARFLAFGVSIVAHEAVIFGMFGLVTPWLAIFSLLQFPLMSLMRSSFFKGKRMGNLIFWISIIFGSPLISALYARELLHH